MYDRPDEFSPYWLQTAMPSSGTGEMPGQPVMFPWEYPWPHTGPQTMWPASDPSGASALPPALASAPLPGNLDPSSLYWPQTATPTGVSSAFPASQPADQSWDWPRQSPASPGWDYSAMPMPYAAQQGEDARLRGLMPTSPSTPPQSSWDPSSPSLWSTPAGADAEFPRPPLPDDPNTRAMLRMRQSVQPDGGRKTGTSTETLEDSLMTIPSALARGTAATLGGAADARESALEAGKWLAGKLGYEPSPEQMERIRGVVRRGLMALPAGFAAAGPTSETIVHGIESVTGPLYQPRTPGGKIVNSAVELVPGAAVGGAAHGLTAIPGAILRNGIIPGVLSEVAGQLTQGTPAETYARLLAGIGSFGAATAAHASQRAGGLVDKVRKAAAEFLPEVPVLGQHLYHQAHEAQERQRLQAEQEQMRKGGGGGW